jgi:transposase
MNPIQSYYVGADVAKHSIAFCADKSASIHNSLASLCDYLGALPQNAHVICEATGRYHHALREACARTRRAITCHTPAPARHSARSFGKLHKTDGIDASLLRKFGQERRPAPTPAPDPALRELLDLLMLRSALVEEIGAHRKRDSLVSKLCSGHLRSLVVLLEKRRARIDGQLEVWLGGQPAWEQKVQTLCLATGVRDLSALQLLAYLPELGSCNRRQIAKLAGVAPLPDDSGSMHGARRIRHGRHQARRVLYLCAVVASHHNPVLSGHYKRMRERNMPAKAAYIAIARKLLVFLNSLLRPANFQQP